MKKYKIIISIDTEWADNAAYSTVYKAGNGEIDKNKQWEYYQDFLGFHRKFLKEIDNLIDKYKNDIDSINHNDTNIKYELFNFNYDACGDGTLIIELKANLDVDEIKQKIIELLDINQFYTNDVEADLYFLKDPNSYKSRQVGWFETIKEIEDKE